jgi:hypothetical protein
LDLSSAQRGIARHYRIGPARRGYDDPSYVHMVEAFDGNGLRPLSPVHLRLSGGVGTDITVSWIRRTRIDGDSWDVPDVPLAEETESYLVRVIQGGVVLRQEVVTVPGWTYSVAAQVGDGLVAPARIEVAQISARYGAGLFAGTLVAA